MSKTFYPIGAVGPGPDSDPVYGPEVIDYIRELEAEVEALKKDAGRYRWLRDQATDDGIAVVMKNKYINAALSNAENIDSYIDAAMQKEKP